VTDSAPVTSSPAQVVSQPTRARRILTTVLAALALAGTMYVGARSVGVVPALGAFLDPANGVWAMGTTAELPREASASIPGLGERVQVLYDVRGVPHIFAATQEDAYRALGYVVARDRLFQLELQTRAAAGTLTELFGIRALDADRDARSSGLPFSARHKLAAADSADEGLRATRAYAAGVNSFIDALHPRDYPVEFKMVGKRPMRWEVEHSIHLLHRMWWTLTQRTPELRKLHARALVGATAADALFPRNSPIQEPIQPNGQRAPRYDHSPLPPPGTPDTSALRALALAQRVHRAFAGPLTHPSPLTPRPSDALGSNNWAVAPGRTRDGHALLAGDPHLELTLPSIWYEVHLVVPGELDVYGVTIPGAPNVIIGFNRDIAWTFTNTDADVLDYYAETVDDAASPTRYRLDGEWRPLERRVEVYRSNDGVVLATDTIYYTHRGPMLRDSIGGWLSMRWTAYDPWVDNGVFHAAARARSASEFLAAMASYVGPPQNMLVADRGGTIAIRSTGRFPLRPGDGRGDLVRDGSTSASDWTGVWPAERYPQGVNPPQGYLASANQQPIDPAVSTTYLGGDWFSPWRAMRINELLRADSAVTVDAMRRYQTDPGSPRADAFVPFFLDAARKATAAGDERVAEAARLLAEWDRRYTKENERAVLFELAMEELDALVWDELRTPDDGRSSRPALAPGNAVLFQLLSTPDSPWWDRRSTGDAVETRDDLLVASLTSALDRARREHGDPNAGGWRWERVHRIHIRHLLGLPGFSVEGIAVNGGPSTLAPSSMTNEYGPSWRMVVELGPELRAWSIYPGGQSGNPASSRYTDRLSRWIAGELDSLVVPTSPSALDSRHVASRLTLEPAR
jgi:penicillin amidase